MHMCAARMFEMYTKLRRKMGINHFECVCVLLWVIHRRHVNFVPIHSFIKNTSTTWNSRNYVVFECERISVLRRARRRTRQRKHFLFFVLMCFCYFWIVCSTLVQLHSYSFVRDYCIEIEYRKQQMSALCALLLFTTHENIVGTEHVISIHNYISSTL